MISQEYLSRLDKLSAAEVYYSGDLAVREFTVDEILSEIKFTWKYLQSRWPTVQQGFDTYILSVQSALEDLALLSYELLSRLTNQDWDIIISAAKDLHKAKNAGYSGNNEDPWINFRECEKFGIRAIDGIMTRLCDKYVRFSVVYNDSSKDMVNESAVDTLRDLAAYALIAHVMLGERESSVRSNHI